MANVKFLIDEIKKDLVFRNRIISINNILYDEEVPLLTIREHPLYQKLISPVPNYPRRNGVSKFKSLGKLKVF
jgi:hypothetical protein